MERILHKTTKQTLSHLSIKHWLNTVSRLLTSTDMTIGAIAGKMGFSLLEQFSKAFKKYFGMTTTQNKNLGKN
ncbi:helix-turn-helix domain-containing protein [Paenibacillus sp. NPDC056579]|uniref:helix-turn-helix domain-containing protein n=1 Tax=Paenibacillus sp. NPDC056579 TaxID=3345871 RepID=UPI0036BF1FE9